MTDMKKTESKDEPKQAPAAPAAQPKKTDKPVAPKADEKKPAAPEPAKGGKAAASPAKPAEEKKPKGGEKPPTRPRAVVAGTVAFVALLVAVGVGGGGYWLWQQFMTLEQRTAQLASSAETERQSLAGRIDDLSGQLSSGLEGLRSQQQALNTEMKSLYTRLGTTSRDWMIAEAEYLMQLANQRLQLVRDVDTAIAALADADQRLKQIGDPALLEVREAVAKEIAALRAVDTPDISGMSLTIKGLQDQVDQLPLLARYQPKPAEPVAPQAPSPKVEDWRSFLNAVWESLKSLVVIRYSEKPVTPLLPPEQVQNLYENLALKLESARLALLQQNQAVFRSTLGTAQQWLDAYFNTDAQAVSSMMQTLRRLGETNIKPPLPDISGSVRLLRQVAAEVGGRQPAGDAGAGKGAPS